ncbi:hypothetical protein GCM10012279_52000 [Micromonospora yangpuensis]|uniref:Uncharacterized protein n=2 Tax=Micromonosporaceae TaxID=28056 RepID=A0A1C6UDF3_9ACTN|nr:hypothetical protein [Micromonospora yangpuensis]GGM27038.1 hypothetical protein GCM10012279_52000 [Micromonospora yangpuensis]SCL52100.1 hypothetical protein GA0070617_1979 [Micromonospora yangpuensis]
MATALLTLLLATTACGPDTQRHRADLRVGYDSMDGDLAVWPPRGSLAGDAAATGAVTEAVRAWRSPIDDRAHLPTSGILYSGEVDGTRLALVAADVPGESASWLLQLSAQGDRYVVDRATDYTDPGYLVYADVLPVHTADGRRYLTSGRVERLLGPKGKALAKNDGLTDPADVPACAATPLTVTLRATESLPRGRAADRLLDLGTATTDPRYPLVRDEGGAGRKALQGLDTCLLAEREGPFGSIPRRIGDRDAPRAVPLSWPMEKVSTSALGEVALGGGDRGKLEKLSWETDAGAMTAVIYRPAGNGPVVFSRADRANPLQTYVLPVPGQPLVVLSWQADRNSTLSVPPGTPRLVDRSGLVVVPEPEGKETFSLAEPEKTYYRSVGGR